MFASQLSESTYDKSAIDFLDAALITDTTIRSAINRLVINLKGTAMWGKLMAIYPFVGGTSASCAWNLKDTTTFKLTYTGTPTFASTGMTPSTANYADTNLADNLVAYNNVTICYYSRTNSGTEGYDMGCNDASSPHNEIFLTTGGTPTACSAYFFRAGGNIPHIKTQTTTLGLFLISSTPYSQKIWQNGNELCSAGIGINTSTNVSWLIGMSRGNNSGARECAFAAIGQALNDFEQLSFYNIIQTFQTSLSRNV